MARTTFWNLIAKKYARDPVADQASYDKKLAMTRALLRPDMRLLEVGCGTGTTAMIHAPHVAEIDAHDFSKAMIEIARTRAKEQGVTNVTFAVRGIDTLPETDSYDMVMAHSLLHLLDDPAAAVQQLARQVKSGGYVVTSTTCIGDMAGLLPRILPWIGMTGLIPKVVPLTRKALLAAHDAAGLEIVDEFRPRPDAAVFLIAKAA